MEPEIIQIEGRCYRLIEKNSMITEADNARPQIPGNQSIDVNIVANGNNYTHCFYVPKPTFGFIIGAKGAVLKKLQEDTKTIIKLPRFHQNGDVVITGASPMGIVTARHQISAIVEKSRNKLKTHFLSIPMRTESIASSFAKFKADVLGDTGRDSKGVEEGIFQKFEKMHLTLAMLVLLDDDEIKLAIDALEECREKIIKPIIEKHGVIKIKVQGLEYFNEDPTQVRVLFGKVSSENDALQELAEKVSHFFSEKRLTKIERDTVKLHLTLMNSSFLINKKLPYFKRPEPFDTTNILKVHQDYFFGETTLSTIHICELGPKAEDGYYQITARINLND